MRSWLSDILLWEILRDVEFSTFLQPKILTQADVFPQWGDVSLHVYGEGRGTSWRRGRPSVWAMVWRGALIHGRGNITQMYVTFLLLFQLNFIVQVWAPHGFWDRIHFLCFEEAGSLPNRVCASFLGWAALFSRWMVNKFIAHRLAGWLWGEDQG